MARILLVDEPDVLASCSQTLSQYGHDCRSASCCAAAMRCMMAASPDLVILNPHLGGSDGMRTLEAIKEFDAKACVVLYAAASLFGDTYNYFLADRTLVRQPDHSRLVSFVQSKFGSKSAISEACTPEYHVGVF